MNKNIRLEFIRGLAALEVFICHLLTNNAYLKDKSWTSMITNWATEAVIIFFLLSGIVINFSQKRKGLNRIPFVKNRLLRIYPLFLVGLLLAVLTLHLVLNEKYSISILLGNIFLLGSFQSFIVPVIKTNPVVWSLTYEMFFYLAFALAISRIQKRLLFVWFILSLLCMPFYYLNYTGLPGHFIAMFSFSAIWLVGYYLYEYSILIKPPDLLTALFFTALLPGISRLQLSENYYDVVKYFIFSIFTVPLFLYCLKSNLDLSLQRFEFKFWHKLVSFIMLIFLVTNFSHSLFVSRIIYIALPAFFLLLNLVIPSVKGIVNFNILKNPAVFLGKISYAVYIIHFPIVLLINYYMPIRFYYLSIIIPAIIVLVLSWVLEKYFQSFIVKFFKSK